MRVRFCLCWGSGWQQTDQNIVILKQRKTQPRHPVKWTSALTVSMACLASVLSKKGGGRHWQSTAAQRLDHKHLPPSIHPICTIGHPERLVVTIGPFPLRCRQSHS